ncbi:MAG: DNA polymerase Y family protein [Acidobacteria bacterium]|nr:DNA polymerase Y family protein [Acidobacteriota bacterium]NIQ87380.1 DNA polymerase Y family protein [Acidobacteriota bacterium]
MDRTACVDLPAFPLQLLLQDHPDWHDAPVAVVDRDHPQGVLLWVNEHTRRFRVLPGMRYAEGLSLTGRLRAAEVPQRRIDKAVSQVARRLRRFTPDVEPAVGDPGSFWLDAGGLERLFPSLHDWASLIRSDLEQQHFTASLVVGFTRFGSYALARSRRTLIVLKTPADERAASRRVPLDRLNFETKTRDTLDRLGVRTVGGFMDLPAEGIAKRFGPEVLQLHRLATGTSNLPLQPQRPVPPALRHLDLDGVETSIPRLVHAIERELPLLLQTLVDRGHALTRVHLGLRFEKLPQHVERIRPAAPTLDVKQLVELIRLRLEAVRRLPDGVTAFTLAADSLPATEEQLRLFEGRKRRDPAAADRALARLRAELGDASVVRARLRDAHLPEARFIWEQIAHVQAARPGEAGDNVLVRRLFGKPVPLPSRARNEPDGWMLRGLQHGPVIRTQGPYIVSGGWWHRPVHREYHFAETQKGELLWVYYDRIRRRWFMHGRVE